MCSSVLREVVAHGGSTVDDRWRPWKTQDSNIFHGALLTYSNHGAVRTYEKFCYWMSWLRARLTRIWPRNLVPRALFPGFGGGAPHLQSQRKAPRGRGCWPRKKKRSRIKHFMYLSKREKAPNLFSRLKLYFPDAFQVCKIALNCKLQDSFKNFMTLIKGAMSRNLSKFKRWVASPNWEKH